MNIDDKIVYKKIMKLKSPYLNERQDPITTGDIDAISVLILIAINKALIDLIIKGVWETF
tara:strand:- start:417 stop:596 length:180 start_codon:yes stop_codon:yes gene_type:complete